MTAQSLTNTHTKWTHAAQNTKEIVNGKLRETKRTVAQYATANAHVRTRKRMRRFAASPVLVKKFRKLR